jgi:hypothetical protein
MCVFLALILWALIPFPVRARPALSLNPQNPHYFLFRGKPELIITSGEHYGAVLNLDFDYIKYLNTLKRDGLNGTRTWSGAYCESPSDFNIASNTLAPMRGRFLAPWARSSQPGYLNGGNKFDLHAWEPSYFKRLKDFMAHARKNGIIVELNLFCPFYNESMWRLSPMNPANNSNGIGPTERTNVYTLDQNGGLLAVQDELVRKLVTELEDYDNLYYEICNEPYFGGVTIDWQRHIADTIGQTEQGLGARHLISQNIANYKDKVRDPHPGVSIFNFHYATPPDTVELNFGLNKVIGDNETGFRGTNGAPYRMEGWDFIVAGGGLYNNLDYSFVAGHEDGTFVFPATQPGAGSPELRRQLRFLSQVIHRLDFVHMRPENQAVKANLPAGASVRALVKPGLEYLVYIRTGLGEEKDAAKRKVQFAQGELPVQVTLPSGKFAIEWLDTKKACPIRHERLKHNGGEATITNPAFTEDIALTIRKL